MVIDYAFDLSFLNDMISGAYSLHILFKMKLNSEKLFLHSYLLLLLLLLLLPGRSKTFYPIGYSFSYQF